MSKASPILQNFNGGEWSPLMAGRTDLAKYPNALETCLNYIPTVQGPLTRRPGTRFVAATKDTNPVMLVRFEFSVTQAYILEFGNLYIRFYKDNGRIEDPPGTPVEVVSPYASADLFELNFVQSADTLYIVHTGYEPRTLTRTSHIAWTLSVLLLNDGPYLATNIVAANTLTPSGTTGSITLTAVNDTFVAADVDRVIRFKDSAGNWTWLRVTAFSTAKIVTATVKGPDLATTGASADWRLGLYYGGLGFPATVSFHEDRLFFGGTSAHPQRIDASNTGDYTNFNLSSSLGVIADDHALSFTLNSNDVQVIRWMASDEKGLLVGTAAGEWLVRPSTQSAGLTPTDISAKQSESIGSAAVSPVKAGRTIFYVQRATGKLLELAYRFEVDGFRAPDMTVLSEHITRGASAATSGIKEMAYQKTPQSILWAVRNDGALLGFTYERDQEVVAWHRHTIGGSFSGGAAQVLSCAVIPSALGKSDELWMIVKRTIDGATKQYVEYMTPLFDETTAIEDAFFVDSGATYDGAPATTISGLDHLEGQTVQVLADGAAHPDKTVGSGDITLDRAASVVQAGLGYNSDGKTMRLEAGAADGTAQGKTKRIHRMIFRFLRSVGFKAGPNFDTLDEIQFRDSSMPTDTAIPPFSGDKELGWPGDYETEAQFCFRQDQPLPSTVLAIMPQLVTQDRG